MDSKICIKCKKEKHLIHFHKSNRTKDKHNSMCKKCIKKYSKKKYKKYYWAHKEEQNKRAQDWKDNNREYVNKYAVEYRSNNKEKVAKLNYNWKTKNRERRRELNKKLQAKRKRNLGYKPINKKETGMDGHHIDKNLVIYIPQNLHTSIQHKQHDLESMRKINILAIQTCCI